MVKRKDTKKLIQRIKRELDSLSRAHRKRHTIIRVSNIGARIVLGLIVAMLVIFFFAFIANAIAFIAA